MLRDTVNRPRRILMTIDAVGGLWRYGVDLARGLSAQGIACVLVGCGPEPDASQLDELHGVRDVALRWIGLPLDWMAADERALEDVGGTLLDTGRACDVDLLHLNLPSQAASIRADMPVVVASHSCIGTWWDAVRGSQMPADWQWQVTLTGRGLRRADVVLVPTRGHCDALRRIYGPLAQARVVSNATAVDPAANAGEKFVLAAGRWWDDGKNAATLDAAACLSRWPLVMAGALDGPNGATVRLRHADAPGELPRAALSALMRRAAVFASAARYEPFGLAVLEAAMHGAALVLADIATFRELWHDAALFVAADDAAGFAAAFDRLAAEPALRRRLATRAGERARRFTSECQVAQVRQAYATALAAQTHLVAAG
jgi:glycosyltransferase involved in cell wall biosynthesis